ncbi:hypothetical protein [Hellea balneolensis]|uniref:hypothetical protein n=1 Tax=Hellea balneolensis TaxID=287478 RepID=UPI00047D1454|nr:hypothetical protein [Hellea balneolensis]
MSNFNERIRLTKNNVKRAGLVTLMGGLMAAISPSAFAAGTPANTTVTNSYVLDYSAGGVTQDTVSNANDAITFTVDRIIDLTVTALGDETVVPGATDQELLFSVSNMGNDLQAYKLRVMNGASDDFDVSSIQIFTALDDGDGVFEPGADDGHFTSLDGDPITDDIHSDAVIWVKIRSAIPSGRGIESGAVGEVTLIAETLEPSTAASPHTPVYLRDSEGDRGADTLLADTSGTSFEMAKQGDHSATNSFQIDTPQLTASTEFRVHHQEGIDCENPSGPIMEGYAIPGACVEYKFIFRNSADSTSAEDISFTNTLDGTLKFAMADMSGFSGGTIDTPGFQEDCGASDCNIAINDAALAAGNVATLTIRALLK